MTIEQFLDNAKFLLGAMALLAILEGLIPFHRSGALRLRHFVPNIVLTVFMLALNVLLNAGAVIVTVLLTSRGIGLFAAKGIPMWASVAIGVVTLDLFSYLVHWLMHKVPGLWRVHSVHHSDPFVDVTTAYRQHPLEGLIRFVFTMAPAWALGLPAEAVAIYRMLSATNALLEHTNIRMWQPLDTAISALVVTPNMHKVHHSREQRETDSNYGNILAVYDRLFGTFTPTSRAADVKYGLDGFEAPDLQTVGALLRSPFQRSRLRASG